MLVGDIVGYTRLTEAQIPAFATHFLGRAATLMASLDTQPIVTNTWGDAIYCVFDRVSGCGARPDAMRSPLSASRTSTLVACVDESTPATRGMARSIRPEASTPD